MRFKKKIREVKFLKSNNIIKKKWDLSDLFMNRYTAL